MSYIDELCARGCGRTAFRYYKDARTCEPCYRAAEFYPGHWPTGDRIHFLGRCGDCTVRQLAHMTLDQVEHWYRQGVVSQDAFEAYTHVWATASPRFGTVSRSWQVSPTIPEVVRLVAIMRGELLLQRDAKRLASR